MPRFWIEMGNRAKLFYELPKQYDKCHKQIQLRSLYDAEQKF